MNLVYDRTEQDVETARTQRGTALTPLKGCYNVSDLNRVSAAAETLAKQLTAAGYPVTITPQTFAEGGTLRRTEWEIYLANVQALRDAYYTLAETGELPKSEDKLDYQGANTIEKILADIDLLIDCMKASYRRCGTFRAGNNAVHLPLKGSI